MKKRIRKRILAVLLAAALAAGNSAPAALEALAAGNAEEKLVTEELTRYPVVSEGEDKELPEPPGIRYEEDLESLSEPEESGSEMPEDTEEELPAPKEDEEISQTPEESGTENTESSEEEEDLAAGQEEPEESENGEAISQIPEESEEEQPEPEESGAETKAPSEEEEDPAAEQEEKPEEPGRGEETSQAPEESGEEQQEPETDGEREQLSPEEGSTPLEQTDILLDAEEIMEEEISEEEAPYLLERLAMEEEDIPQYYANLESGTSVVGKSGWTYTPGNTDLPATHMGINFREGISGCVPFINDGADVSICTFSAQYHDWYQMHPNNNQATGKYGMLYTNVAYDGTYWYDLKCTVSGYTTSVEATDGRVTARPAIAFGTDGTNFLSNMTNMQTCVRFDLLRSDTGTSAKKNIRFQLRDIDLRQRFGLVLGDGKIEKKYYFSDKSIVYVDRENAFGKVFETYIGQGGQVSETDDPKTRVCFEASNCGSFYLLFGPLDTDDNYPKAYYKALEKGGADGKRSFSYDGESHYVANELLNLIQTDNPVNPMPLPEKYVSKTGQTGSLLSDTDWTKGSIALNSATDEFYYMIRQDVPWQSDANRYSAFSVTDTLPAGVDYVSFVGITSGFRGEFSGRFNVSVANQGAGGTSEKLTITAKDPGNANFAGNMYDFVFKVRMDPAEMMPTYNGNGASYQVTNRAEVTYEHNKKQITQNTNSVTTTAAVTKPSPAAPVKGIGGDASRTSYTAAKRTEKITYSIFQAVPAYVHAFDADASITMTDVLEPCWKYEGAKVYLDGTQLSSGWTASADGRTITVSGANLPDYSGRTLRFDITVSLDQKYDMSAYRSASGGAVIDTIPNTAKVKFYYPKLSPDTVEKSTNTVQVIFRENAVNLAVKKTNADTGENIPDAEFTVYEWDGSGYNISRGRMSYDASGKAYRMEQLIRTASNAGKFKVAETATPAGYTGSWSQEFVIEDSEAGQTKALTLNAVNQTPRGTITVYKKNEIGGFLSGGVFEIRAKADIVSPEGKVLVKAGTVADTITTGTDGRAVSRELYLGTYTVTETKAPAGYAVSENPKDVTLSYQDKNTERVSRELTFTDSLASVHLRLTKEIDTADIVFAQGNPAFTFKVEGTDLYGRTHTYYETVEFTKGNTGSGAKARLTADITVYAGTYRATEEKTMRYKLRSIHSVANGTADGTSVSFDLSKGADGAAVFYNAKTTDENLSHTVFVRNVMQSK